MKNLNIIFIVILFIWASFFIEPLQSRYYLSMEIILFLVFVDVWARKGNAIFKSGSIPLWVFIISLSLNVFFVVTKEKTSTAYLNIALPMVFIYYITSETICDEYAFYFLARTICICSIFIALIWITGRIVATEHIYKLNPKVLASCLVYSWPFSLFLFKRDKGVYRRLAMASLILGTLVIILTFSRMALFGLVAMITFYFVIHRKYILLKLFYGILLIIAFISSIFSYPFNSFSIGYMIVDGQTSVFSVWNLTKFMIMLDKIKEHPFIAMGLRNGEIFNNTYLTILAESGIIGFSGFLLFILYLFRILWKNLKLSDSESQKRWFLVAVFMSYIGLLIDMIGYDVIYWSSPYLYFCILTGLITALCSKNYNICVK